MIGIEPLSLWIEVPVALLLVLSGLFTLSAAVGVVRFKTFFQRMHPPALAFSFLRKSSRSSIRQSRVR